MKIFNELKNYTNEDLCLVLGFFDGVHQGHKVVISTGVHYAKEHHLKSALITFDKAPTVFLKNKTPEYILNCENKYKKIENLGIDYLYVINFDEKFSKITASDYLKLLVDSFSPKAIVTGENHFFGFNRSGNSDYLELMKTKFNYEYFSIPSVKFEDKTVSSSRIRENIESGNINQANLLLGYRFFIEGQVVKGRQIGQKIGFRTANLEFPKDIAQPPCGVYAVEVVFNQKKYIGIANYGSNPTITDDEKKLLEVHILNFNDDIYGQHIKVNFLDKIRDEKKFQNLAELKAQIAKDIKCLES